MGKPILTTAIGDIPNVVGEAAYVAEPDSPSKLAELLKVILTDPAESAMKGRLARERFLHRYSLEAIAPSMHQILSRLSRR